MWRAEAPSPQSGNGKVLERLERPEPRTRSSNSQCGRFSQPQPLTKSSGSTPSVVPGAAPAFAKAGVGGLVTKYTNSDALVASSDALCY